MNDKKYEYLSWIDRWILAADPLGQLASEQRHFGTSGTHVLGFVYVDHTAGVSMDVDGFCNLNLDGSVLLIGGPRQQNESLKVRYDLLAGMDIALLDDNERNRLGLPIYPDWLPIYHHSGAEPLRCLPLLHPLRAEGYPDDVKFLLPADTQHRGEVVWGRLENSIDDNRFECVLLNEPDQEFGLHAGEHVVISVREISKGVSSVCLGPLSNFIEE
ncbi:MAG: hypothetical protein WCK35_18620 [Chloroflexota bacterium]